MITVTIIDYTKEEHLIKLGYIPKNARFEKPRQYTKSEMKSSFRKGLSKGKKKCPICEKDRYIHNGFSLEDEDVCVWCMRDIKKGKGKNAKKKQHS